MKTNRKPRRQRKPVNPTPEIVLGEVKTTATVVTCHGCKAEVPACNFCDQCGHDLRVRGKTKKLEQVEKSESKGPGVIARCWAWACGLFSGLMDEFRGASDLFLAKVKPVRNFCNAKRVRVAWGVATAVCGATACIMWSPVWLGLYVGLITLYTFLEPMFQVAAAVVAPVLMVYARVEQAAYSYIRPAWSWVKRHLSRKSEEVSNKDTSESPDPEVSTVASSTD